MFDCAEGAGETAGVDLRLLLPFKRGSFILKLSLLLVSAGGFSCVMGEGVRDFVPFCSTGDERLLLGLSLPFSSFSWE